VAVNSKGHILVFSRGNTTRPRLRSKRAPASGVRSRTGNLFTKSATICNANGHSRTRCGSTRMTTSGPQTKLGHGDPVQSQGQVTLVFGSQDGSFRRRNRAVEASEAAAASVDGMFRQVTDMTWIPPATRHQRRLHQFTRRKSRQECKLLKSFGEPGRPTRQLTRRTASPRTRRKHLRCQSRPNCAHRVFTATENTRQIQDQRPFDYANAAPAIGNKPRADLIARWGPVRHGRCALRPA